MRKLLLLLLLLGAVPLARAQQAPVPVADSLVRPALPPAAADTAAALHRYFRNRRQLKTALLVATGLTYGIAVVAGPDRYGGYDGPAIRIVGYTPLLLGFGLGELIAFGQFSHRRERRALADLQAHRLSPELARRLKPSFFVEH